tara:strand:- start:343 stop:1107 length:765 start_codon:yes stop_codon:yes gene_type:complete
MNKLTYFFSHDFNAHQDEKVLDLRMDYGFEGYGIYWMIVELLAGASAHKMEFNPKRIAFSNSLREETVSDIITKYGLFEVKDGMFTSASLIKRMSHLDDVRAKRKESGRLGGIAKAKAAADSLANPSKTLANATVNPSKTLANATKNSSKTLASSSKVLAKRSKGKERKGKEMKEDPKGSSYKDNKVSPVVEASADSSKLDKALESNTTQQAEVETQPPWHGCTENGRPLMHEPTIGTWLYDPNTGRSFDYEGT